MVSNRDRYKTRRSVGFVEGPWVIYLHILFRLLFIVGMAKENRTLKRGRSDEGDGDGGDDTTKRPSKRQRRDKNTALPDCFYPPAPTPKS